MEKGELMVWLKGWRGIGRKEASYLTNDKNPRPGSRTFRLMDGVGGGNAHIPDSDLPYFLDKYISDVSAGVPVFLVEHAQDVRRFFVDMDYGKKGEGLPQFTKQEVYAHVATMRSVMQRFADATEGVGEVDLQCIVLFLRPEYGDNAHIVFPKFKVTDTEQCQLRAVMISELEEAHPDVSWGDVFDDVVLSLRAPFANKLERCHHKKGDDIASCDKCLGGCRKGKDLGRQYGATIDDITCIAGNGTHKSAREVYRTKRMVITDALVSCSELRLSRPPLTVPVGVAPYEPPTKKRKKSPFKFLEGYDGLVTALENELHRLEEQGKMGTSFWCRTRIEGIRFEKLKGSSTYEKSVSAYLRSEGSKYCPNKGEDHAGRAQPVVCFTARDVAFIKCTCKCDVARATGKRCSDWVSNPIPLTPTTGAALRKALPVPKGYSDAVATRPAARVMGPHGLDFDKVSVEKQLEELNASVFGS